MALILIVDDSPTQQHQMTKIVKEMGHDVVTAVDGRDGVKKAIAHQPDAILMDVVMPHMNGYQATREITRTDSTSNIPVILVTTKNQVTDKVWGMRQGARAYITKPVVTKDLVHTVNQVLENKH